jgi:hypothetical protein
MLTLTPTLQGAPRSRGDWESGGPAYGECRRGGRGRQVGYSECDIGGIAREILPRAFLAAQEKIVSGAELDAKVLGGKS